MATTMTATSLPHGGPSAYASPSTRPGPPPAMRLRSQPSLEAHHYGRRASIAPIGPPPPMALPDLPAMNRTVSASSTAPSSSPESMRISSPRRRPSHLPDDRAESPPRGSPIHPYAASAASSPSSRRREPREPHPHEASTASSNATQTGRTRTKSVLAIALSRANQAVEFDEANDVSGAIEAYQESVKLLREVMARVEQTNAAWRARERERDRAAARRPETEADRERRAERLAREEARIEESRRLQTIHDTYEERITMLTSMLNGEGERPTSSSSSNGPVPMDHRPRPSIDAAASRPLAPPAAALPSRPTTGEEGMLGIGNAMLSDAASVKSHGSPSEDQQATIRPSRMPSRPSIDTKPPHGRTASQVSIRERQSPIEAPITIERFRDVQSPEHPTAAPAPSPASVRVESPDLRRTRHTHSASTSTNSSGEFIIPVTATEFGLDWPGEMEKDMSTANRPIQATGQRILAGHVKHDSNGALITILGPPSETSTPRPSQPRPIPAEAQEESFMRIHRSTRSSSSSASSSPKDTPLPPLPIEARAGPPPGPPPSVPPPPRPMMPAARQSRTASLAGQSVPGLQTQNGSRLLISASTAQGTISQRRRTPTFEQVEEEEADQSTLKRNAAAAMQPKDAPAMTMSELGVRRPPSLALASAPPSMPTSLARRAERGSETGSLPMRLRTLSQPGKRPGLPSFATGGYPELPSEARASTASIRKVSAPVFMHQVSPPSLPPTPPSHDGMPMTYADDSSFVSAETPTSAAFAKTTSSTTIHSTSSPPPVPSDMSPSSPISPVRRPFQLMRRLRASINQGAYVSAKLYVPKQVWAQAGVKLSAVETKIRMVELLISGLEGVERAGDAAHFGGNASGTGMKKELDAFDGLLDGIQSTLAKKLGFSDVKGKKNGPSSISSLSSKLSRSFDRMTNAKSLDAPALYVETLSRLFAHAQVIDRHIALLSGESTAPNATPTPGGSPYDSLNADAKTHVDARLRRASDFFGTVVCRFVLRDIGLLLDKHVKRAGAWCID